MDESKSKGPTQLVIQIIQQNYRPWSGGGCEAKVAPGTANRLGPECAQSSSSISHMQTKQQDSDGPTKRAARYASRLARSTARYVRGKLVSGLFMLVALLD